MTECFCGCGQAAPRFPLGIRTINKRGKLIRERLEWARAQIGEDGEPAGRPEWLAQGDQWLARLRTVVHGEPDPEVSDDMSAAMLANRAKPALDGTEEGTRRWMEEGRAVEALVVPRGATPINQWLKQRGQS
jgi:hypothetical protein